MDPATDVDNILKSLGQLGHRPEYSCRNISVTTFLKNQKVSANITEIQVSYRKCKVDVNINVSDAEYNFQEPCPNGFRYSIPTDRSTVTEWNLVCDGATRSELAQTMIMAGQGIGAAIFSPLADRFGRKPTNVASRILYLIAGTTTMFSPSIAAYSVFRLLIGTFQGGLVCTTTTLTIEILPKELRHRGEGLGFSAWTTGIIFTSILCYFCRDLPWRYLQFILGLLSWHCLIDWIFLDESLRWLIANGKNKDAERIIKKAAKINKIKYESVMNNIEIQSLSPPATVEQNLPTKETNEIVASGTEVNPLEDKSSAKESNRKVHKYSTFTILRHRTILIMSLLLWFVWITNTFTYYGLMLTTSKLAGDRYLNNILASLSEIPAIILQQSLLNRIGRRYILILFHGISGTTLILATVCTNYANNYAWLPLLSTIFSMIGRSSSIGSFRSVFLFTPELYPTSLRNLGLGMASTVARIGSIISPFANILARSLIYGRNITEYSIYLPLFKMFGSVAWCTNGLAEYVLWGPAAIFALMNVIATCIMLTLPETMGRELPTTIQDMRSWRKGRKGLFDMRMPKTYLNNIP